MGNICILIEDNEDMVKKCIAQGGKDNFKAIIVTKIAKKRGVTKDYIYKILSGERNHPEIFEEYMTASEGLVEAVNQLVPFN